MESQSEEITVNGQKIETYTEGMFKCISVAPNRKAKPTLDAIKKDQAA